MVLKLNLSSDDGNAEDETVRMSVEGKVPRQQHRAPHALPERDHSARATSEAHEIGARVGGRDAGMRHGGGARGGLRGAPDPDRGVPSSLLVDWVSLSLLEFQYVCMRVCAGERG